MNNNNTNTVKGFATTAGEGERIWFVADTLTLKATAVSTGKSYTVVECLTAPGGIEDFFRESGQPATNNGPAPQVDEAEIARMQVAAPKYSIERAPVED